MLLLHHDKDKQCDTNYLLKQYHKQACGRQEYKFENALHFSNF